MFETNNLLQYFEKLAANGWATLPVNAHFAQELLNSAKNRFTNNEFHEAGLAKLIEKSIRSDKIRWLDLTTPELTDTEQKMLSELEHLQKELSDFFRVRLVEFEGHYAVYQKGQAYTKHTDQKKVNNKRFFSMVVYLNENWQNTQGGKLIGYNQQDHKLFELLPQMGQAIIFRSDLVHEVSVSYRDRWSLTGWFRVA